MIAAIYIYPNSVPHLFGVDHDAITLNLGGKYFYKIGEVRGETKILKKQKNHSYIDGFWPNNISIVSAIVGANGTGKSSILQAIKNGCQLILEKEDESQIIWSSDAGQLFYYTPYLTENKSDEDRSNVYNLSKLSQMSNDSKFENMDFSSHWEYHKSERLKRIILLIESDKFKQHFLDLGITTFDLIKISFSKIAKDNSNVSRNFIPYFTALDQLKEKEWTENEEKLIEELDLKSVEEIKKSKEYQLRSRKSRLKLTVLESIIRKVHSILENTGNKFLEEGYIDNELEYLSAEFSTIEDTKDAFFWFIERAYFKIRKEKYYLPVVEIKNFTNLILDFVSLDNKIDNWTILTVNFSDCKTIIDAYQNFLFSFKDIFTYDEKIFITFSPDKTLSTGEISFYELFSSLNHSNYRIEKKLDVELHLDHDDYIVLLDEADLGFHPFWKRKYIKYLSVLLPRVFTDKKVQLIITTHDPLTLSDIPNNNIIYLKKENNIVNQLGISDPRRPRNSFAANITDLLANSFFVDDGLIGDFAKGKIQEVLDNLNFQILKKEIEQLKGDPKPTNADLIKNKEEEYKNLEGTFISRESQYLKSIIEITDEPILKFKMEEMFYLAFPNEIDKNDVLQRAKRILGDAGLSLDDLIDDII